MLEPAESLNASCADMAARCARPSVTQGGGEGGGEEAYAQDSVGYGDLHARSSASAGAGVGSSSRAVGGSDRAMTVMREELGLLVVQMAAVVDQQQLVFDDLVLECKVQRGEADKLALETRSRVAELTAEKEACAIKMEALVAEKEELAAATDSLLVEKQALKNAFSALVSESQALLAERDARERGVREREEVFERSMSERKEAWESAQRTKEADSLHIEKLDHALQVRHVYLHARISLPVC